METDRILIQKKLSEIPAADGYFRRLSGIDPTSVPVQYGDSVSTAHAVLLERATLSLLVRRMPILHHSEHEVQLTEEITLCGEMPPKVLAQSKEVICFVGTLTGFSSECDDMMEEYFIDTWGSAYIEAGQAWLAAEVQKALDAEGYNRTHLWCPGQHQFELNNQRALFALLSPEDVGCTLTKRLMMVPAKSVSGIMGIVPTGTENLLVPCDFCRFRPTCPSRQNCAAL